MADIGDVYTGFIYFKGNTGDHKDRPFLIIDYVDELYTIVEITSVEPKNPPGYFDTCKQYLEDWSVAGLEDPSWAKCHKNNIHRIDEIRFHKYLGSVTSDDFFTIFKKITEVNT